MDTTYTTEYAVPWQDLKVAAGHVASMEVQINDNSGGGRDGLVNWASTPCYGWRDSLEHGAVVLAAAPAVTEAETEAEVTEPLPVKKEAAVAAPATADTIALTVAVFLLSFAVIGKKKIK